MGELARALAFAGSTVPREIVEPFAESLRPEELRSLWRRRYASTVPDFVRVYADPAIQGVEGEMELYFELAVCRGRTIPRDARAAIVAALRRWVADGAPPA